MRSHIKSPFAVSQYYFIAPLGRKTKIFNGILRRQIDIRGAINNTWPKSTAIIHSSVLRLVCLKPLPEE
jgi:hypothetical protein